MQSTFLCALIIKCKTPDELAGWYRDVLGLPFRERDGEFSSMLGHVHFAIHGIQDGESPTSHAELGIYVADVDGFVGQLESKRVKLADPVRDYPWARSAQIKDPLGNTIYLMQLPKSSLDELGKLLTKDFGPGK